MVIVNLVAVVIWVPVAEEIFFRGFLLKTMLERHTVYVAIPLSSLLFALLHGRLGLIVPVFLSSVVISILFIRTRSLLPPILAHSTQNLVVSVVAASA
ncbi:MAG: CPBP family intramembrane glutamic endopeptidase [Chloroflexota bacterium]|nr:CPBP family intramembrane glutamic endopeptidase [Chloroflexota bacterium]